MKTGIIARLTRTRHACNGSDTVTFLSLAGADGTVRCSQEACEVFLEDKVRKATAIRSIAIAAILCALTVTTAAAQAVTGSQVSGVVKDTSGAALPGAEVTITKTDTGAVRTTFTGTEG